MMAHSRGRHEKKIDTVHWTYGSFTSGSFAAGTSAVNVNPAQHLPETLLRIRGEWTGFLDGAGAPTRHVAVGVGLIQVPEGTGSTVLWSPITDGDAPWIWVDYAILAQEEMVIDVIAVQELLGVRRVIDSKAMRKMRNTELQCVFENATIDTASAVNIDGQVRVLAGS